MCRPHAARDSQGYRPRACITLSHSLSHVWSVAKHLVPCLSNQLLCDTIQCSRAWWAMVLMNHTWQAAVPVAGRLPVWCALLRPARPRMLPAPPQLPSAGCTLTRPAPLLPLTSWPAPAAAAAALFAASAVAAAACWTAAAAATAASPTAPTTVAPAEGTADCPRVWRARASGPPSGSSARPWRLDDTCWSTRSIGWFGQVQTMRELSSSNQQLRVGGACTQRRRQLPFSGV